MARFSLLFPALFIMLAVCSCHNQVKEDPVNKQEALKIARQIELAAVRKRASTINQLIDLPAFCRRMEEHSAMKVTAAMKTEIQKGLNEQKILGSDIIESLGKMGSYSLLKRYEKNGKQHLLFRLHNGAAGFNYHDYELVKINNQVKFADFYVYSIGRSFSSIIGDKLNGKEENILKQEVSRDLNFARQLASEQNYSGALNVLNGMPDNVKNCGSIVNMRLEFSGKVDSSTYRRTLGEVKDLPKGQPDLSLMLIDLYVENHDYPNTMMAIDDLDRSVGTDPLLDYLRAVVSRLSGDSAHYYYYTSRVYAYKPSMENGAAEMIYMCLLRKDYVQAEKVIAAYHKNPAFDHATLDKWLIAQKGLPAHLLTAGKQ